MNTGQLNPLHLLAAFLSGGLLTLMVHFNAELAFYGGAMFSSWAAHGTGTVAAIVFILLLAGVRKRPQTAVQKPAAPLWAYLGGVSGAATVMLTSTSANSSIALSGTLSLGLAGQIMFGLAADQWGLFGLPKHKLEPRGMVSLLLIACGSLIIIFFGRNT